MAKVTLGQVGAGIDYYPALSTDTTRRNHGLDPGIPRSKSSVVFGGYPMMIMKVQDPRSIVSYYQDRSLQQPAELKRLRPDAKELEILAYPGQVLPRPKCCFRFRRRRLSDMIEELDRQQDKNRRSF